MPDLTKQEEYVFEQTLKTGNINLFTEYFFRLPDSGTYFTPQDRVEQYSILYRVWKESGKPDDGFDAEVDGTLTQFRVRWDVPYYGQEPLFLLHHGFRMLPWLESFLNPSVPLGIAITGTGTGKTCGVAIWALACCALFPGFRFLNVAPSRVQAELMLNEIEKWCLNTRFRKFIVESNGVHPLWVARPHAQLRVEVSDGFHSTFVCQTVNRDATSVLGQEQDFINCDEAQLLENISESVPILATRMRGTRSTGQPRWGMLRWISNPGRNPELVALMEHYEEVGKKSGRAIVLEGVNSSVNVYVTKAQLEKQKLSMMSNMDEDRWHGGEMSAAAGTQLIPEELLEKCTDDAFQERVNACAVYDDMLGLREYSLPFEEGHSYVVAGDVGQSNAVSMSSMNVPCVMVFDVTRFLDRRIELSAFWWRDGNGSYRPFIKTMQRYMIKYRATGFYDATNVQTALEDVRDAGFDGWPTTPVYFSGSVVPKRWALTIVTKMMDDKMFMWPYIKAMWHQARIFDISTKKKSDDIIATLMVFGLALRMEDTLWTRLEDKYNWQVDPDEDWAEHTVVSSHKRPAISDRYSRIAMLRW